MERERGGGGGRERIELTFSLGFKILVHCRKSISIIFGGPLACLCSHSFKLWFSSSPLGGLLLIFHE